LAERGRPPAVFLPSGNENNFAHYFFFFSSSKSQSQSINVDDWDYDIDGLKTDPSLSIASTFKNAGAAIWKSATAFANHD